MITFSLQQTLHFQSSGILPSATIKLQHRPASQPFYAKIVICNNHCENSRSSCITIIHQSHCFQNLLISNHSVCWKFSKLIPETHNKWSVLTDICYITIMIMTNDETKSLRPQPVLYVISERKSPMVYNTDLKLS